MDDRSQRTDEPDGFRVEYHADTRETALIFKLRGPGLLSVNTSWQPATLSTVGSPHRRALLIENENAS